METPKKLSSKVVALLLERHTDEMDAFYFYAGAANWCDIQGFAKLADFFRQESLDEREHAKLIEKYLVDWNVNPKLERVDAPKTEFKNIHDLFSQAYQIEYALYEAYEDTSKEMFNLDLCAFDFLTPLRKIQNDSVIEYSNYLNQLQLIKEDDKFQHLWFNEHFS
jgi:ferritin